MKQSSILFNRATCLNTYHVFEYQSEGIVRGCLERNAVAFEQQYCETINVSMGSVILPSWGSSKSAPTRSPTTATFQYPEVGFLLLVERLRLLFLTSCLLALSQTTQALGLTHPPKKNTPRLTHIQTQPHSDSLTIRLTHNQFSRTQTHTQAHPHSDSLSQGTRTQRYPHNQPIHIQIHALWASQGVAARGALHSQPEYSHSDSPDIKLPHTQADSYSKQHILMWQA